MSERSPPLMPLTVARTAHAAVGIHVFELVASGGQELPPFTPGAHVTVRAPNGQLRKYSLANDCGERHRYVIAVKREAAGRGGSASLVDDCGQGALLACSAPQNDFELSEKAKEFLFIAGGIGITPIMSMVRHLALRDARRFKLHYLTRLPEETAFLDELRAPPFSASVAIHHDGGDPGRSFDLWPLFERPRALHVYCCGPRAMLQAVRDMSGHWSTSTIHIESFADAGTLAVPEDRPFRVRLARSGTTVDVGARQSILEALREHGLDVPSSCESGTCGTCRTRLLAGDVDHRDLVLSDAEHADNIMVCVSRARSPEIVIDR
ncbi:MAG TPA: PDR/VanB family oxidoreductase [Casimicrobiaceae bacterium]|nr:PDR/VanB family oxidoreductase [Casimicrobiaceae bacterium]